jgi:tetratricopeptide (TPR) repeat protein/DNA-binding CsgD family transcriptional regulator
MKSQARFILLLILTSLSYCDLAAQRSPQVESMREESQEHLAKEAMETGGKELEIRQLKRRAREEEAAGDYAALYRTLRSLGTDYRLQYHYDLALESHFRALEIADSLNDYAGQARVQHAIGAVYLDVRNLEMAHERFTTALELYQGLDKTLNIGVTLNSLALTYWMQGELDTALNYLFRTLSIEQEFENMDGIARSYNNIGIVYHEMGEFELGLTYLQKSLALKEHTDDTWSISETLNNIGENFISQGRYAEAEEVLNQARELALEINALVLLSDNYRYMSRLYKRTGAYREALEYKEEFIRLEDSLFNRSKLAIIHDMTSTFQIERQENQLVLQESRIELLEKQKKIGRLQNLILWGFILVVLVVGAILFSRQRKINLHNSQMAEKDRQIQLTQARLIEQDRQEKERLQHELEQKNSFLIDFALCIGMKNDVIYQVKEKLKGLARMNQGDVELRTVIRQLNQNLRKNRDLMEFQENVEKVNVDFLHRLDDLYPGMTENEKQLAMFLRLNMSSKEISDFRAVSIKAVEMSRYRLRKKLNLGQHDSLRKYIQSI